MRSVIFLSVVGLLQFLPVSASAATSSLGGGTTIAGQQKQWHKVTLTFAGPTTSETDSVNPFRDYRLNVTFKHVATNRTVRVPGYFAADGDAANTSAVGGNKWRVHFAPDATGTWTYAVSFRSGKDVAVSLVSTDGTATSFNGTSGSFTVDPTDKTGADFRGKGRLQEVGQHYLQHLGTKEYFVKAGAGSPENLLAFADFDNTTAGKKILHYYAPHAAQFRSGDPTWKGGKGKALIGALNYLAGKGMNSVYFLTMNLGGDGDDVYPYINRTDKTRFDVSKLAQWEVVFEQMDKLGLHMQMVTQENENDQLLDGGALGATRKLYYRELVARFGHHLGLTWNLGEENTNTAAQRMAFADYFNALDPYLHLISVHTFPQDRSTIYTSLLGNALISGASLQIETPSLVHAETLKWVTKSAATGSKWVVTVDEIGDASVGVVPDVNDPEHGNIVHRVLWASLMAGGAGVEWYFGYNYPNHDLTCENWMSRDRIWTLTGHAIKFFRDYMPLPLVTNYDALTSSTADYCLGKSGVAYAVYLPDGITTSIALPAGQTYSVHWFNPRTGGSLQTGTVTSVGGGTVTFGRPPYDQSKDWVALLRRSGSASTGTSAPAPAPAPVDSVSTVTTVSKLGLINASTQGELRTLTNGGTISLATDGSALNVRAYIAGTVGSVAFTLDGVTKVENAAPYAMAGDDSGVYRKWTPRIGTHTLRVTPYTLADRKGTAGTPLQISFTVK